MKRKYRIRKLTYSDGSVTYKPEYRWFFLWWKVPYYLMGCVYFHQTSEFSTVLEAYSRIKADKDNRVIKSVLLMEEVSDES